MWISFAAGALLAAAIWALALERVKHEREAFVAAEITKNSNLAQSHAERAARSLQALDEILLSLRSAYAMQGASVVLADRLDAMQADRKYVGIVSIIGREGELIASTAPSLNTRYTDRDYFKAHATSAADQMLVGPPIVGRITGKWILSLTRRISRPDGSFGGVVFMSLDPAFFAIDYERTQQGPRDAMALIGLDGITRARRNGDRISFGENIKASQLFKAIPKASVGHYTGVAASDGHRRIASYRVLDNYPMVTLVASSLEDVLARSHERERIYLVAAGVSTLGIAVALALMWSAQGRRKRILASFEDSERRYRLLFQNNLDAIVTTFRDGRIMAGNPAACRLFGYSDAGFGQTTRLQLFDTSDPRLASLVQQESKGGNAQGPVRMLRADGSPFEAEVSASLHSARDGLSSMVVRDVSERKQAEDQIKNLAFYDALTHLPNRRLLMDRLHLALAASHRHQRLGALLFVDLDNFKILNDTLGHHQGDLLLQQVAERLLGNLRDGDTCARLGGDEFVVMLEDLSEDQTAAAQQAEAVADKLLAEMNVRYSIGGIEHHSTPSIGITLFGGPTLESIEEPLKRADLAMYQAKAAGRNTVRFFDPQIQARVEARATLEVSLREALDQHQLLLHYQPQVVGQSRVFGAEVLVRWRHPVRGLVSPAEFIPLAEETGLILPLGAWVLETACKQLAAWAHTPGLQDLTLSVNVSERQFRQPDFVEGVTATLARTGARASLLKLELTEGLLVTNVEDIIAKMRLLKAHGVGFSLDDFGTGYSSLSYLKRLPLDQLKIDQGFVRDILVDPNDAAIAKMVIVLAESLGLKVIAEGVETEAQRRRLAEQGCDAFQGYLFCRPVPVEEFERVHRASMGPPAQDAALGTRVS